MTIPGGWTMCSKGCAPRALVWLLASALVALGTADPASSAAPTGAPTKAASVHRKRVAGRKKRKGEHEKVETKRPGHVIDRAAAGDAAAPLPPALSTAKQAIALIRQGKTKDALALAE